ncbi:MAG: TIGR03557 family F420-dependent LLM class oxidoreductase [Acidimicrobiia bacterium]
MTDLGYALMSEEHDARTLVRIAQRAEAAGFRSVWISDHYHPWIDRQGQSPFVWAVIGAIAATTDLTVTTGVTCPIVRIHPAILAQATATCSNLLPGERFRFGVGSGEALNEHILGDRWPPVDLRHEMLVESMDVIRQLWTGKEVTHRGRHYTVENARIYTGPDGEIPILVSAFGPAALAVAKEHGDGWITTKPDEEGMRSWQDGGSGPAVGMIKCCWGEDAEAARALAHEVWPTSGVPGQLSQDLPTPAHLEQAVSVVSVEEATAGKPCGPDPEPYLEQLQTFADLGFDEVTITQIGPDQEGFFRFFERELRPRLGW